MLIPVLSVLHNATTMLFGIFISAFLLGVKQNKKNLRLLFSFFCVEGILYLLSAFLFGADFSNQIYPVIYPFIIHLPLTVFLVFYYKFSWLSGITSVCSTYLCCQISNWIGLLVLSLTGKEWCYYFFRILTTLTVFFILSRFVCHTTAAIFAKNRRALGIICFLPFLYYVFDYASTKFSSLLYSGNKAIVEFMGFAFCIAYFMFLLVYFKQYEQAREASQYNSLMELQLSSIRNEAEHVKASEQTLSILRHDMRHHLSIILTMLQNDSVDKVTEYIKEIGAGYDDTILVAYCKNEIVNAILSIYHNRFQERGITLNCDIICESITFSEIAFCAILSNALENAMHALENVPPEKKWASLTISTKDNSLLLQLENPTENMPEFVDGVPVSSREGHGIGVRSIIYYVEQLHGQWYFSVSEGSFFLRVII